MCSEERDRDWKYFAGIYKITLKKGNIFELQGIERVPGAIQNIDIFGCHWYHKMLCAGRFLCFQHQSHWLADLVLSIGGLNNYTRKKSLKI